MLSLSQLRERHETLILFDSASTRVQVGVLLSNKDEYWETADGEAGSALFACTASVLQKAKRELSDIDAFIFCEGPGSMLGIRTAAMALRTWSSTLKPVPSYAYRSLEVLARQLSLREAAPFSLVADARREMWHCVDVAGPTTISSLLRISSGEVKERTGKLFTPDTFRAWAALPPRAEKISYNISALMAPLSSAPLFREKPEPDAMLHEEPSYKTWVPQVHRASVQESIS